MGLAVDGPETITTGATSTNRQAAPGTTRHPQAKTMGLRMPREYLSILIGPAEDCAFHWELDWLIFGTKISTTLLARTIGSLFASNVFWGRQPYKRSAQVPFGGCRLQLCFCADGVLRAPR